MIKEIPESGEVWHHPDSRSQYMIHSLSTDGWVRYYSHHPSIKAHDCYPLWTQPVDRFIKTYKKVEDNGQ